MIGLTVVAIGTGAPEIAATVIAALRNQTDLAMANLIGSNIFNLLGILGTAALWRPLHFDAARVTADGWWMLGSVILLLPVMLIGRRITRPEGGLLLALYGTYLVVITRAA
jgi:cation:H+ antiporter